MQQAFLNSLRERVLVQRKSRMPDGMGGFTESWHDVGLCWANIQSLALHKGHKDTLNAEISAGQKQGLSNYYKINARYFLPFTTGMRLVWNDQKMTVLQEPVIDRAQGTVSLLAGAVRENAPLEVAAP